MENIPNYELGDKFSVNLKNLIEDKGYSVSSLSNMSGVNENTIRSYINYNVNDKPKIPSLQNAIKLSLALGVTLEYLCDLPEIPQASQNKENDTCKTIRALSQIMDMGILSFDFDHNHDLVINRVEPFICDDWIVNDERAFQNDMLDFIEEYLKISETLKDAEYSDYKKLCLNACIDKYIDMFTPKFGNFGNK
jgi:transcriptional regulator with XRE-family HTH domain